MNFASGMTNINRILTVDSVLVLKLANNLCIKRCCVQWFHIYTNLISYNCLSFCAEEFIVDGVLYSFIDFGESTAFHEIEKKKQQRKETLTTSFAVAHFTLNSITFYGIKRIALYSTYTQTQIQHTWCTNASWASLFSIF